MTTTFTMRRSLAMFGLLFLLWCRPGALAADESRFHWERFAVDDHTAFVIMPTEPPSAGDSVPWVLYAPTFDGRLPNERDEGWMIERFLDNGIAVAGIDIGESFGSPAGRRLYSALHTLLVTTRHFDSQACLLARSRGGLMLYTWAADHPEHVRCIAGIYPVCDLRSYPGLERASTAWGLSAAELESQLDQHNPVSRLRPLADAGVRVFHIHGESDQVVPLNANSAAIADSYRRLGGRMQLRIVPNQGHNMWRGFFECEPLVAFIITEAHRAPSSKQAKSSATSPEPQQ